MKKEKIWPERYQPHQTLFDNSASGYTTLIRKVSAFVYHPKLHSFNYHFQCRNKYFLGYLSWILGSLWTTPLPSRATPSSLVDNIKTFRRYSNSILYIPLFFFLTERKQGRAWNKMKNILIFRSSFFAAILTIFSACPEPWYIAITTLLGIPLISNIALSIPSETYCQGEK